MVGVCSGLGLDKLVLRNLLIRKGVSPGQPYVSFCKDKMIFLMSAVCEVQLIVEVNRKIVLLDNNFDFH